MLLILASKQDSILSHRKQKLRNLNRLQNPPLAIVINPFANPNIGAIVCRIQYHAGSWTVLS